MFRVLIIEDEKDAAQALTAHIKRYGQMHGVIFDVEHLPSAVEMLGSRRHFDACFLDIELPGISGMEAAHIIRTYDEALPIVFVTNLAKYAVKGYEVGARGFIVKPATFSSVSMNLDRLLRDAKTSPQRSIAVHSDDDTFVIPANQLTHAEVVGHQLTYHVIDREPLTAYGSLGDLTRQLDDLPFVRVSRSCLANMDLVSGIRGDDVLLKTGERLHIPRGRKKDIVEALSRHLGEHEW